MGKQVTPELKYKVISLWYRGHTRDEISEITGLSTGTISNILKEFKEKMQEGDFEAIQAHARLNRELGLDPTKMLEGHRTNQILEKNGVTQENVTPVIENCAKVTRSGDTELLLQAASEILAYKEKTGKSIGETSKSYVNYSQQIPELEQNKKSLIEEIADLDEQKLLKLKDAKTTQEILDSVVNANIRLSKHRLSVVDFIQAPDVLEEFARHGYDPKKIFEFFKNANNLSKTVKILKTQTLDLQNKISAKENHLSYTTRELDSLNQKYKKYCKAIKVIENFLASNQDPNTIIQWEKILRDEGIDVSAFDLKINEYHGIIELLQTLREELKNLDLQKEQLLADINSFAKILQDLQNHKKDLETQIEQLLKHASEEILKFENSNPLSIIRNPNAEPHTARLIVILFLKELKKSPITSTDSKVSSIQNHIDFLIGDFEHGNDSR